MTFGDIDLWDRSGPRYLQCEFTQSGRSGCSRRRCRPHRGVALAEGVAMGRARRRRGGAFLLGQLPWFFGDMTPHVTSSILC